MDEQIWVQRPWSAPGPAATDLGRWEPITPGEPTLFRRELSAVLRDGVHAPAGEDGRTHVRAQPHHTLTDDSPTDERAARVGTRRGDRPGSPRPGVG